MIFWKARSEMERQQDANSRSRRRVNLIPILLMTLVSLVLVQGCGGKAPAEEEQIPANYSTYKDETGLFSISYPPDWEPALSLLPDLESSIKDLVKSVESDLPVERASVIFLAGLAQGEGYSPNVTIVVESLPGIVWTHSAVVEAEISGVKKIVSDYREFSRTKTTVGGRQATILDWQGSMAQIGTNHVLQMIVLISKTAWVVTCTPPPGEFDEWESEFQSVVRSLRILK
jgi:hypothetical protein